MPACGLWQFSISVSSLRFRFPLWGGFSFASKIGRLATLPSRDVMLAQLGGAFQAPLQGMLGAMNGLLQQWVGALEALKTQRGGAA